MTDLTVVENIDAGFYRAPSAEKRQELTALIMKLFDRWGLSSDEQAAVLGLADRRAIARYRQGSNMAPSRDLMDRVELLLDIHNALKLVFAGNADLAYAWMKAPNVEFSALSPIQVIFRDGFLGLLRIAEFLRRRCQS
ncbi:DUF2384 domain-containing protein [bacterium]|nr:DUF2384 domain-containing protein [bacterium]